MPKKKPTLAQLRALLEDLVHTPFLAAQAHALEDRRDTRSANQLRGASILAGSLLDFLDGTYTEEDVRTIFTLVPLRLDAKTATNDPTHDAPSNA